MTVLWLIAVAVLTSYCVTWAVRRYAMARQLIDIPNERSSHDVATARGGGLAIVLTFLGLLGFSVLGEVDPTLALAICGGGGIVAAVGFLDDHFHLSASVRLIVHIIAVVWGIALTMFGSPALVEIPAIQLWPLLAATTVGAVWLVNLYNFMDGIDAIASIEAITVSLGGALVLYLTEPEARIWLLPILLAAAVSGFLWWNYPPARIFMGDAGSGFLGFVLAVFCLKAASHSMQLFWAWVILLGVFIVDSSVAVLRRLLRGERLYEAHRSHAYQHAAREYGGHAPISLAVGAINLVYLMPLALLVALSMLNWAVGLIIAYLPLLWLAVRYRSGVNDRS